MRQYSANEKNNIVEMLLNGKKSIREISEDGEGAPAESTIRKWIKQYKSNGPFVDSNKNDAVASWSGYGYQGKMAILCAVEKLNTLYGYCEWEKWKLQLEKLQDFVLLNDLAIDSLWQVKAKLSSERYQDYEDAMKKILADKANSGYPTAGCFLITAKEIKNWNDSGNTFQNDISLYKYKGNVVDITSVPNAIEEQLEILIGKIGIQIDKEAAYLLLCDLIDDKVAEFHKTGKCNQYIITFEEIVNRIKNTVEFEKRISSLRLKEEIYKNVCEKILIGSQRYCEEICSKKGIGKCNEDDCAVNRNKELVDKADIELYMRSIRPEVEKDIDFTINNADNYTDTICCSVYPAPAESLELENNIIYEVCFEGRLHAIPTMLDMSKPVEQRLSRTLSSIENNKWLKQNIGNKFLIGDTGGNVYGTKLSKFTNICLDDLLKNDGIINKKDEKIINDILKQDEIDKATEISNSIIVLDRELLIKYFEEEEDDESGTNENNTAK